MDAISIIGLVSAVAGLASLFIPDSWKSKKGTVASMVILSTVICGVLVNQQSKLNRIRQVSRAAEQLLERQSMDFTNEGFTQACLSFLEQNKDLYPDSYSRAIKIASDGASEPVQTAFTIKGQIKGISLLNSLDQSTTK